jgi:hypothetical protein
MGIKSTALRNARLTAISTAIDAGSGAGHLKVYSGSRPAGPGSTPGGTLLADIVLNDPSCDAASAGSMALDVSPAIADSSANATGTATFARFEDSDGNGVYDVSVSATGGGSELTFPSTSFVSGTNIGITSFTFTEPAGS